MADDMGGADVRIYFYNFKKEFISEEVQKIIDDSIHQVFGIKEGENAPVTVIYAKDKVTAWTNQVIDYTIRNLSKLGKPFKYCVTSVIQQNNGAGFIVTAGAYYDNNTDGFVSCQKEINDIVIIVSVFAMLI